MQSNALNSRKH